MRKAASIRSSRLPKQPIVLEQPLEQEMLKKESDLMV
jgi:hypothetical protein